MLVASVLPAVPPPPGAGLVRASTDLHSRDRAILALTARKLAGSRVDFSEAVRALREAVEESIPAGRVFVLATGERGLVVGSVISGVGLCDGGDAVHVVRLGREGGPGAARLARAMRGTLGFDPNDHDYGPATLAVRRLLTAWQEIDWFAPPAGARAPERARRLFERHNWLARQHRPDLFPERLALSIVRGDFARFLTLAEQARGGRTWDWKYQALKPLSHGHAQALGWKPEDYVEELAPGRDVSGPGHLVVRVGENAFWQSPGRMPDFAPWLGAAGAEVRNWYLLYAWSDLTECLQWQLAERRNDFSLNPFAPLLAVYGVGLYPLSFSFTEVTLFEFALGVGSS